MKGSSNLDLLRAIAVMFVVVSHAPVLVGQPATAYNVKALGHIGVAMFFVHTTLVLMHSLERQRAELLPFLVRRVFRIYPLSITVVCLLALAHWAGGQPMDMRTFLSNLLLVQNLTGADPKPHPLWTLPFELQMYLVLPAIYAIARRSYAGVAALLLACVTLAALAGDGVSLNLLSFAPCFICGALAYASRGHIVSHRAWLWAVVATGAILIPLASAAGAPELPMLWVLCLALAFAIPRSPELAPGRLATGAKLVATYSYGIYLTHVIAFGASFLTPDTVPSGTHVVTFVVVLTAMSVLGYHLVEKPGIALGIRLAARLRSRGSPVAAQPVPSQAGSQSPRP
jgi:peptidoglycan/LPS O-acetylase OafA/YrhL